MYQSAKDGQKAVAIDSAKEMPYKITASRKKKKKTGEFSGVAIVIYRYAATIFALRQAICLQRDILLEAKPYFPYRESLGKYNITSAKSRNIAFV